jgi:hypothetical protein
MSDNKGPYEKPSVEEVDTGGAPIETAAGQSQTQPLTQQ